MKKAGAMMQVLGMVQGVGFRFFVRSKADALGLTGYVRNMPDGSVEVRAEGPKSMVEELIKDVRIGPSYGSVRDVTVQWYKSTDHYQVFEIKMLLQMLL